MKILVCTFVRDRFPHLKLCTKFLHSSSEVPGAQFEFVAFDDLSSDKRVQPFLKKEYSDVFPILSSQLVDANSRLGFLRSAAVQTFLLKKDLDYLLLLDSDIIVTKKTIVEAIGNYNEVSKKLGNVGGATLHALGTKHLGSRFKVGEETFSTLSLTGDAHMLFRRDHLTEVGNHFGSHFKGFADTQIREIIRLDRIYWTRIDPPYQVQHIGIGEGGSSIFTTDDEKPAWTTRPYWTYTPLAERTVLQVDGFDVLHYCRCVEKVGGSEAPLLYMEEKGIPT